MSISIKLKHPPQNSKFQFTNIEPNSRRKFLSYPLVLFGLAIFPRMVKGIFLGALLRVGASSVGRSGLRSAVSRGSTSVGRSNIRNIASASKIAQSTRTVSRKYASSINKSKFSSKSSKEKTYHPRKRSNVSVKTTIKNLSEIADILPDLAELANSSAAEAIWIKEKTENEAVINLENNSSHSVALSEIYLVVRDIKTGEIESRTSLGLIQAEPNAKYPFEVLVSNLPNNGIKRIEIESEVECQPSRNIVVV